MQKLLYLLIVIAIIVIGVLFKDNINSFIMVNKVKQGEKVELKAGETIQFKINNPYNNTICICELRVPKNYSKEKQTTYFCVV